jgi:diphthamide biosynthesis methyltransferase
MPRTTLLLEADAMRAARAHAERHRLTLGQAVSDLVRKAVERPLLTDERSGLRVVRLNSRSPKVRADQVDQLRDELP